MVVVRKVNLSRDVWFKVLKGFYLLPERIKRLKDSPLFFASFLYSQKKTSPNFKVNLIVSFEIRKNPIIGIGADC